MYSRALQMHNSLLTVLNAAPNSFDSFINSKNTIIYSETNWLPYLIVALYLCSLTTTVFFSSNLQCDTQQIAPYQSSR